MILKKLKEFLDLHKIDYEIVSHREAYTAQEIAQVQHIPGKDLAKAVIVKAGEKFVMVAIPASYKVQMDELKKILGIKQLRLATEDEMQRLFPDCQIGAQPPFGNLYNVDVLVDEALAEDKDIIFQAGTHKDSVRMHYDDFEKLVHPKKGRFAIHV